MSDLKRVARLTWFVLILAGAYGLGGCDRGAPTGAVRDGAVDAAVNPDGAVTPDAAVNPDGAVTPDAAVSPDGAVSPDAASVDAAITRDGAVQPDAHPGPDAGPMSCTSNAGCDGTEFCEKSSCFALTGTCVPRPTTCTEVQAPVCDCDGVTFWNDCLRQQQGRVASHSGECGNTGRTCGGIGAIQCPSSYQDVFCSMILMNSMFCAMMDPSGACWVLPPQCPAIVIGGNLRPCANPSTSPCLGTCDAIRTEASYYPDSSCPM